VERSPLWRVQTPQGFPREMIERAHAEARRDGVAATDDAGLCERLGLPVVVVPGSERALKVTEEGDFARAEALAVLPA
jgi:2-C-methyl-D-erythritol 4-phosphate cytidylyltransferase